MNVRISLTKSEEEFNIDINIEGNNQTTDELLKVIQEVFRCLPIENHPAESDKKS